MDKETLNKKINSGRMPVLAYIAFVVFLLVCYTSLDDSLTKSKEIAFILSAAAIFIYLGLSATCKYKFDTDGLTVIYYGIFRHKFSWEKLQYAGVCLTSGRSASQTPFIICSKYKWMTTRLSTIYWFFFPFSAFQLAYSPMVYDEIKKVCPNLEYVANRERVFEVYYQRNKK